jgi:hypothetical protein
MEKIPDPAGAAEILGADAVEQVVPGNHHEPHSGDRPAREPDKAGEHDHRGANRRDDLGDEKVEVEAEGPAQAHDHELDQHEPEAARQ